MRNEKQTQANVSIADDTIHELGEGALWDAAHSRLFYVDIIGRKLSVLYPENRTIIRHDMPSMIGTVVCHTENEVLVALVDGIYKFNLETQDLTFLACPPENDSTQRFNDGKCDPAGRFWVGTMSLVGGRETSHLFCLDHDGTVVTKLDGISTSNGIVWSKDEKFMYYIDTPTRKIMEYAYDKESGEISKPRVAVTVADTLGYPDGMAIDADDNLWVAMWGGSAVCCFDRLSGKLINKIAIPAKNVTSCAFGGPELTDLYITTARIGTSEEELESFPDAGKLFKTTVNTAGSVSFCY